MERIVPDGMGAVNNAAAKNGQQFRYRTKSCADLVATEFETRWLVDYLIIEGQPLIVAGGKKTLKTSLLIDLALSLVWPCKFLSRFWVPEAQQVGLMTGESGLETVRETILRVADSKGIDPAGISGLVITEDVPVFGDGAHVEAMRRWILDHELSVVIIDPAYMCLSDGDAGSAGNLFIVGQRLRSITTVCRDCGVTLILAHHTRRNGVDPHQPGELEDIAWAGFQEFARQWLLLARREKYQPGTGSHRLWLSAGGSAGHGGQWGLDVEEGIRGPDTTRHWDVTVRDVDEIREAAQGERQAARADRLAQQTADDCDAIVSAMRHRPPDSKTGIRERTAFGPPRFNRAWETLVDEGRVRSAGTVTREGNKQTYPAWGLANAA